MVYSSILMKLRLERNSIYQESLIARNSRRNLTSASQQNQTAILFFVIRFRWRPSKEEKICYQQQQYNGVYCLSGLKLQSWLEDCMRGKQCLNVDLVGGEITSLLGTGYMILSRPRWSHSILKFLIYMYYKDKRRNFIGECWEGWSANKYWEN